MTGAAQPNLNALPVSVIVMLAPSNRLAAP